MNSFANLLPQLRLPVFGSPMFIASGPELVKAQCQAGIIGSFPTLNARPAAMLTDWLDEITESNAAFTAANPDRPAAPFAVNLIVHRSNNRLEEDLAEVVRHQVPIVVTSLGAREEVNEAVHSYGGIVLHDVINNKFAHKAVEKGADGVIAVASGAGGHAGALSPFALVQEIRTWFDGPLLLSGAIAHGRSVLAALAAGADCAYVGSAFLSTTEANVVDDYKQMIVDSAAEDVVYSNYFTGVKGNYLRG
ncbi:MAG: NAD(P)H-dependent flavin oxidoreductase, partial [Brevibacterium aurantiacum]